MKSYDAENSIGRMTKMMVTIGPSTNTPEMIDKLVESGVDGYRLNFSHGNYPERDMHIQWIRAAAKKHQRSVAILLDLQGPKIRLGEFDGKIELEKGSEVDLIYGECEATQVQLPVQYDLSKRVKPGQDIYIFDGKVKTEVVAIDSDNAKVKVKVLNDGIAMEKKGLNLPDTDFSGEILTEKDHRDIEYGLQQDIDYIGLSFVQSPADIQSLREILDKNNCEAKIIAKIETKLAVQNLEDIIKTSDAVMVARGDLGVEVPPETVPIVQRKIIGLCREYDKVSIVATQMLASMVDSPEPTRAEVSDVATAAIVGADVTMLSDETTNGHFPMEAANIMNRILEYTAANSPLRPVFYDADDTSLQSSIAAAIITLSHQVGAKAVVAETRSGATAYSIAANRPSMPIIAVTSSQRTANQLALCYATTPFVREVDERSGEKLTDWLNDLGIFTAGDRIIAVSGRYPGKVGYTDTIKVRTLE